MQEKENIIWKQTLKKERKKTRIIHWNCKSTQNEKNQNNILQQTHSKSKKAKKAKKSRKVRKEAHKVHQMNNRAQIK
jgi:hypothetical protein